ncbi:hypothetical protein LX16_0304 [Stackebrandtia albiflava]|uniref:DUF4333 domain-containing protein n=1 Tax=Stackebrandtia albiflava TaxID=406432 RepID=A0A562V9Q7_9ACTN|nr:hypothetical protein [Stackebrandtia albiflava]TWJ14619.1 hypothetical protein LX16_0304 [Stackebrandtia albiflava]
MKSKSPGRRVLRPVLLASAALAAAVLSGCGGEATPTDSGDAPEPTATEETQESSGVDFRNGPVPESDPKDAWQDDPGLPEEPADTATLSEQVAYELLLDAVEYTKVVDPEAAVECPAFDFGDNGEYTCTVTYFGLSYDYLTTVSGSGIMANYEYEASERVVAREYVEDALRFDENVTDVFCDMEEHVLTDPEGYTVECRSLADGEESVWNAEISAAFGFFSFFPPQ